MSARYPWLELSRISPDFVHQRRMRYPYVIAPTANGSVPEDTLVFIFYDNDNTWGCRPLPGWTVHDSVNIGFTLLDTTPTLDVAEVIQALAGDLPSIAIILSDLVTRLICYTNMIRNIGLGVVPEAAPRYGFAHTGEIIHLVDVYSAQVTQCLEAISAVIHDPLGENRDLSEYAQRSVLVARKAIFDSSDAIQAILTHPDRLIKLEDPGQDI